MEVQLAARAARRRSPAAVSFAAALCLALLAAWTGCDLSSSPGGPGRLERHTQVVLEPQPGLEGAVRVDSVSWLPLPVALEPDLQEGILEGTFAARFVSLAQVQVQVRYDLRFLDEDDFLVDRFIPFGQPVRLAAGQVQPVSGTFTIRSDDPLELEHVTTMSLHATVMPADQ